MTTPSTADCIAILSAAQRVSSPDSLLALDPAALGLSRNTMEATARFLIERGCFMQVRDHVGHYAVGELSLQGRLRLEQLTQG